MIFDQTGRNGYQGGWFDRVYTGPFGGGAITSAVAAVRRHFAAILVAMQGGH